MKKTTLILIIGTLITLLSCNGQKNSRDSNVVKNTIKLGKPASKLAKTISTIYQDKKSNLWFGSKDNGVFLYDGQRLKQITEEDGLAGNEVLGIQEDSSGNIFVETTRGVSKFDGQSLKTLTIKGEVFPTNKWELKPDDLWFRLGFDKKGPYRYDGEYLHYLEFPKSPQEEVYYAQSPDSSISPYGVYSIYKDSKGALWFGTTKLGFCRFDGKIISWHYEDQLQTTPSGGDFGSRTIFEDRDGLFWFNNSRYRYDVADNSSVNIDHRKKNGIGYVRENNKMEFPFFQSIEQDNDGDLWMVTYHDGVWRNNGKELIHYPIKDGKIDVLLFSIYKDNQGVLWLGTSNAGAYKFNGKSFEKFEL